LVIAAKVSDDIAVGIAMIIFFGSGIAFSLARKLLSAKAEQLPLFDLGTWSSYPRVQEALRVSPRCY
jgi:ABC-type uncharacterized transport system permease subunit